MWKNTVTPPTETASGKENWINSQLRASWRSLMCRLRAPSCPAKVCPAQLSSSKRHKTKLSCRRQWLVTNNTAFNFLSHCKSFSLSVTWGDTSPCHCVDGCNLAQGTNLCFDSQSTRFLSSCLLALATLGLQCHLDLTQLFPLFSVQLFVFYAAVTTSMARIILNKHLQK